MSKPVFKTSHFQSTCGHSIFLQITKMRLLTHEFSHRTLNSPLLKME